MERYDVESVPGGHVAEDGAKLLVEFKLTDGRSIHLDIPYGQFDYLIQALQVLAVGAFRQMVAKGALVPIPNPVPAAQIAQAFRVLPDTLDQSAILQVTGRAAANGPLGMGSIQFSTEQVGQLASRLSEVDLQLRSAQRPT